MKRSLSVLVLCVLLAAVMPAQVPTNTTLTQSDVHLYISQLTAQPIFMPSAPAGTDWRAYFVFQVWDAVDLPVEAFKLTVTFTTAGRKATSSIVLPRNPTPEAVAANVPTWTVLYLAPDAVISSVLVELLVPAASESFTE